MDLVNCWSFFIVCVFYLGCMFNINWQINVVILKCCDDFCCVIYSLYMVINVVNVWVIGNELNLFRCCVFCEVQF